MTRIRLDMPRRLVITKAGSPSVLDVIEMPMPEPQAGEVRVEVHFAGINFADTLMRLGLYQPRPPFPFTPGYEVSGIIDSVGEGVTEFEVGQRVVAAMSNGGQASHVISAVSRVIPLPDEMSLEKAASMPVTYLTAHHMLHHLGNLKSTDAVLIHGGAGGVGTQLYRSANGQVLTKCGQLLQDIKQTSSNNMVVYQLIDIIRTLLKLSNKQQVAKELTTSLILSAGRISNVV